MVVFNVKVLNSLTITGSRVAAAHHVTSLLSHKGYFEFNFAGAQSFFGQVLVCQLSENFGTQKGK